LNFKKPQIFPPTGPGYNSRVAKDPAWRSQLYASHVAQRDLRQELLSKAPEEDRWSCYGLGIAMGCDGDLRIYGDTMGI